MEKSRAIAFWGGLFFLIAPSNAEVVLWKACYHYPVAVLLCLSILVLMRHSLLKDKRRPLVLAVVLYAISTFTLELFYATLPLALLLTLYYKPLLNKNTYRRVGLGGLVPMLLLFGGHFVLYHAIFGNFIPHTEGPLKNALAEPLLMFSRVLQNEFHLLLQGRYWPAEASDKAYNLLQTKGSGVVALLLGGSGLVGIISCFFKRTVNQRPFWWLVTGALIGMVLVLPSDVMNWGLYYNDRYLYFTGLFQWQLLAVALFSLPAVARKGTLVWMGGILTGLGFYTALQCRRSATVFWRTLETFPLKKAKEPLILLAMPANLRGIIIFQEGPQSQELNSHLRLYTGDSVQAQLHVVAGYGMDAKEDGARVQVKDRKTLEVRITQPGAWFWQGTLGATSGETPLYKMELGEGARQYTLTLKDTMARAFYFYNLQWKEVNFAIRDREQE